MSYDFNEEAQRIGERVIEQWHPHLSEIKIAYLNKESATEPPTKPPRGGKVLKLGQASKVPDKYKLLAAQDYVFVIELTAAYWDKLSLTQQEALVDHELCHCRVDADGPYLANHDLEEFRQIVRRHGFWKPDIQAFCEEAQPLFAMPGVQKRFVDPPSADYAVFAGQAIRVEETGDTWTYSVKDGGFVKMTQGPSVTISVDGESVTMTDKEFERAAKRFGKEASL